MIRPITDDSESTQDIWTAGCLCILAGTRVWFWGAPGIGKTTILRGLAESYEVPFVDVQPYYMTPMDISGLPQTVEYIISREAYQESVKTILDEQRVIEGDKVSVRVTKHAMPYWVKQLEKAEENFLSTPPESRPPVSAIMFIDELGAVPPSLQQAFHSLMGIPSRWHNAVFPNVGVCVASNPSEMAMGSYDISHALANRALHLYVKGDVPGFARYLISCAGIPTKERMKWEGINLPNDWRKRMPHWWAIVKTYLSSRPKYHNDPPEQISLQNIAYPTSRTWQMLIMACAAADAARQSRLIPIIARAAVGEIARDFVRFINSTKFPSMETLLKTPEEVRKIPEEHLDSAVFIVQSINTLLRQLKSEATKKGDELLLTANQVEDMLRLLWVSVHVTHHFESMLDITKPTTKDILNTLSTAPTSYMKARQENPRLKELDERVRADGNKLISDLCSQFDKGEQLMMGKVFGQNAGF